MAARDILRPQGQPNANAPLLGSHLNQLATQIFGNHHAVHRLPHDALRNIGTQSHEELDTRINALLASLIGRLRMWGQWIPDGLSRDLSLLPDPVRIQLPHTQRLWFPVTAYQYAAWIHFAADSRANAREEWLRTPRVQARVLIAPRRDQPLANLDTDNLPDLYLERLLSLSVAHATRHGFFVSLLLPQTTLMRELSAGDHAESLSGSLQLSYDLNLEQASDSARARARRLNWTQEQQLAWLNRHAHVHWLAQGA